MKDLELDKKLENKSFDFKDNIFDIIRLIAAFQVMFCHLVEHFELGNYFPLLQILCSVSNFIPGKGVVIFFAISGYLSIQSIENSTTIHMTGGGIGKRNFLEYILNCGLHS